MTSKNKPNNNDFIIMFLFPTLIGKSLMIYFGAQYAEYPGDGYGWALLSVIGFTFFTVGRFLWRHRNDVEEEG